MKAEDKLQILTFLLMLVNSLFVILGISLFGCSAWILFDKDNFITVLNSDGDIRVVAGGLFLIGLVVVGVSVLGCIGVCLENRCFIAFYMGMLIAIVCGQLFIIILLLLKRNRIEVVLIESIDAIITEYGGNNSETTWRLLDSMQQSAKCCGRKDASDWKTNKLIQTLNTSDVYPCSCFNVSCPVFLPSKMYPLGNGSDIYTTGCGVKLKEWSETNIFVILGMDLGLLAIQTLQFTLGVYIYRTIGLKIKNRHPKNLLNATEETPDLQQSNQEYYQPANHTFDQQLPGDYDQEYARQGYQYEDQHYQHYHDLQDNSDLFDQQHYEAYAPEDSGQVYDQYQHHHYDPEPSSHSYDYKHDHASDPKHISQSYDQSPDQYNTDQAYPQTGNYNQGYVHDYDPRNQFDDY
ncbi:tetraspanin-19 [Salminus brasiliensis]|uniref:tetraspanin-19 n=1 Tax=Salminus brasiliensis TaxID=930266 RepID=UPI003B82C83B